MKITYELFTILIAASSVTAAPTGWFSWLTGAGKASTAVTQQTAQNSGKISKAAGVIARNPLKSVAVAGAGGVGLGAVIAGPAAAAAERNKHLQAARAAEEDASVSLAAEDSSEEIFPNDVTEVTRKNPTSAAALASAGEDDAGEDESIEDFDESGTSQASSLSADDGSISKTLSEINQLTADDESPAAKTLSDIEDLKAEKDESIFQTQADIDDMTIDEKPQAAKTLAEERFPQSASAQAQLSDTEIDDDEFSTNAISGAEVDSTDDVLDTTAE